MSSPPPFVLSSSPYRAPTLGTRSPPKPTASSASLDDESEQPALVRFARLKQRELGQARSAPDLGSRTTTTVPQPEKWSVKDTSVQIASAFHQAATSTSLEDNNNTVHPTNTNEDNNNNTSTEIMNPNDAWASGTTRKNVIPRSTSVEYEKETHSTVNRRLGAPPSRLNSSRAPKPLSKTTSLRHVPSSEGEGEDHHDQHLSHNTSNTSASSNSNGRAKSPFFEAVKRYAPTTFFMRAHESDDEAQSGAGAVNASTSVSYDYSAEEREYQAQQQQQQLSTASAKSTGTKKTNSGPVYRRNRISVDNKAYRPTVSDLEESDEDFEEGERRRRRKAKKSAPGGPLTTLPVAGYDKRRKKRRSGTKGNGVEEEGEEESSELSEGEEEEQSKVSEQVSFPLLPDFHLPIR